MLLTLLLIILYLGLFLADSYILFLIIRHRRINISYRRSLLVLILISFTGAVSDILLNIGGLKLLSYVLTPIVIFLVLHKYFKRKYLVDWKESLHIYIIFAVITVLASIIIIVPTRLYFFEPFVVQGDAMKPTYQTGDYLLVKKWGEDFSHEDVVIIRRGKSNGFVIKRIIGLPFEKLEIVSGTILINGQKLHETYRQGKNADDLSLTLSGDAYFVLNDNREWMEDSRTFGPVSKSEIIGTILLKLPHFLKEQ